MAEVGTHVGRWAQIGYVMNNSSNFNYCGTATCAATGKTAGSAGTDASADITEGYTAYWSATNVATLNECQSASLWKLETSQNGTQGGLVVYTATDPCNTLTPNFQRLNTASSTTGG